MKPTIALEDSLFLAKPEIRQLFRTLLERRKMALIHFHVVENDVGYLPDSEPEDYEAVDEAIDAVLDRAEQHMDHLAEIGDSTIIRGQAYADPPKTAGQSLSDVQQQVDMIRQNLEHNEDYTTEIALNGLLVVLDDGMRVIELSPCVEGCLIGDQSHVENW